MNKPLRTYVEHLLVLLIGACFFLPLLAGAYFFFSHDTRPATAWLRTATLAGYQENLTMQPLTFGTVANAKFQTYLESWFNNTFALREAFIRLTNEADLRLFHFARPNIVVGRDGSLMELLYVHEYCLYRGGPGPLENLVTSLGRLKTLCDHQGTALTVLITPSKPAIYPETLPWSWQSRYSPAPRYYDQFVRLLHETGIHLVDGHALTLAEKHRHPEWPAFPHGGTHWTDSGALPTANALLADLASQGRWVLPYPDGIALLNTPLGQDADLYSLANFALPWVYPVTYFTLVPEWNGLASARPTAVFIGGSFLEKIINYYNAIGEFDEIDHYSYYKNLKVVYANRTARLAEIPVRSIDIRHEFLAADCLVLEVNERMLFDPAYLREFLADTLSQVPDANTPKVPFLHENRMRYQWDQKLSFAAGPGCFDRFYQGGFEAPEAEGTWTAGAEAVVGLNPPVPDCDVVLEAEVAGALLLPIAVPEQRVGVYVNNVPVGEWVFNAYGFSKREVVIPRQVFESGTVALQFRPSHPISLAKYHVTDDPREKGLYIASLRLHPVRPQPTTVRLMQSQHVEHQKQAGREQGGPEQHAHG